mmetsp:Transcript_60596/g.171585  ORF Transcript_60596/g.171585 Transcript_60596/m.171585 type:complete len:299 (-) Transcript_60596:337-1233(-)
MHHRLLRRQPWPRERVRDQRDDQHHAGPWWPHIVAVQSTSAHLCPLRGQHHDGRFHRCTTRLPLENMPHYLARRGHEEANGNVHRNLPRFDCCLLGHPGITAIAEQIRARTREKSTRRLRQGGVRGRRGHGSGPRSSHDEHNSRTPQNSAEQAHLHPAEGLANSHCSEGRTLWLLREGQHDHGPPHREGDGHPPVPLRDPTASHDPARGAPQAHRVDQCLSREEHHGGMHHGEAVLHSRLLRCGRTPEAEPSSYPSRLRRHDRAQTHVHEPAPHSQPDGLERAKRSEGMRTLGPASAA